MVTPVSALDPTVRHWWALFDQAPAALGTVERWESGPAVFTDTQPGSIEEFHPNPTLELCLAGTIRVEKPDRRCDLGPGQALLIQPVVWHRVAPIRADALRFALGVIPEGMNLYFQARDRTWSGTVPARTCQPLLDAAVAAADPVQRRRLVADLLRALAAEPVELFHYPHALWRMVEQIWTRARLGVTVDELLAASGLSRTHAYRLFTRGYGMPPKAALTVYRLQLAEGLLALGLPVGEVARRAGFPHPDALRRAWRARGGTTPARQRALPPPAPS